MVLACCSKLASTRHCKWQVKYFTTLKDICRSTTTIFQLNRRHLLNYMSPLPSTVRERQLSAVSLSFCPMRLWCSQTFRCLRPGCLRAFSVAGPTELTVDSLPIDLLDHVYTTATSWTSPGDILFSEYSDNDTLNKLMFFLLISCLHQE